jgi:SAM-dependent methyltransferase
MHIDTIIKARADSFAASMQAAANKAVKEEEIRIACELQLALIQTEAGIKLEAKHEFTVASGYVDSVYDRVLIEYKNPSSAARIGPSLTSPGSHKLVEQIKSRFSGIEAEQGHHLHSLLGVGCDGRHFIFIKFRDGEWIVQDPVPITPFTSERFLRALFNLGTKGKAFTPGQLAEDFGSDSDVAKRAIQSLYRSISETDDPKAKILFNEWRIHFSEICGHNVDKPTDKIIELAEIYGIPVKALKAPQLLFSLHTYFAFFIKLLAAELVSSVHQLPGGTPLRKMIQAATTEKLKRELEDLEDGSVFRHFNITNFLEGDLFSWYLSSWSSEAEAWIRELVAKLETYNPGSLGEDPTESRDLLKKLYHRLFPRSLRHDLGEYYTPDWLAERVLDGVGYDGDPSARVLDPACGSGTFLVLAIGRIRSWYDSHREDCSFNEDGLGRLILQNVIGFDLNPLAVMATRTNYLIAIRDLLGAMDAVELPIYLCDSIMTPSEHGGLFAGSLEAARELSTAAGKLLIPTEIARKHSDINRYAEILETCIRLNYTAGEFVERCKEDGLPVAETKLHAALFEKLETLHTQKRNGIWARIIKNAFAPLFIPKVDYVVGNPPWINWESLPDEYRKSTFELWSRYGLFRHKGYKAKLGGAKDDISILMTYVCHDIFLKDSGKLGFVITQSVFKTRGGGEGFRGFRYEDGAKERFFSPLAVEDLSSLQPFEGAANRTATMYAGKASKPAGYPVPYTRWKKKRGARIQQDDSLAKVLTSVSTIKELARPVAAGDLRSPWLSGSKVTLQLVDQVSGSGSYTSRKGVYCPTNAIYWLTDRQPLAQKAVLVTNLADSGKRQVEQVTVAVENTFVHDLVRGRDVGRWSWKSNFGIILPQDPNDRAKAISVSKMKKSYPKTYAFFHKFEGDIRSCALLAQFFDPDHDPFYSSYNVGSYTYAPYKVVWKEISSEIEAVVIERDKSDIIPDHKLVMVSFDQKDPAYFLSGVLNSSIIGLFVRSYAVQTSISGHIFDYAAIPRYVQSNELHRRIVATAKACHSASDTKLPDLEKSLDKHVGQLLGLSASDVKTVATELERLRS